MKKIIIRVFLTGLFIFLTSTSVFAASFYVNGNVHHFLFLSDLTRDDFDWYSLGLEYSSEATQNKLNVECFNPFQDITAEGIMVRNGILLISDNGSMVYGNFSVMGLHVDAEGIKNDFGGIMLGIESRSFLDQRSYIDCSIDFTVSGLGGNAFDSGYGVANLRLNTLVTDHLGFSLGLNWTRMIVRDNDLKIKESDNGLNLGMFCHF